MRTEPGKEQQDWRPLDSAHLAAAARKAAQELRKRHGRPRQERLAGIHNPWGVAAGMTNAWAFLDICESDEAVGAAAGFIGQDVVLWDAELFLNPGDYLRFAADGREGAYWPAEPLAGAVVLVSLGGAPQLFASPPEAVAALRIPSEFLGQPLLVIRYMSASSRYRRDMVYAPNRRAMRERPLVNYTTRPLWLVRGQDLAGNDFVTGFASVAPRWAGPMELGD